MKRSTFNEKIYIEECTSCGKIIQFDMSEKEYLEAKKDRACQECAKLGEELDKLEKEHSNETS